MPVYEAKCRGCGKIEEYYRTAAHYLETPICCGAPMQKVILTAPFGIVDIPAYQSPIDGRPINSRAQRREDLKRNGCREWEGLDQEKKVADQQKKEIEKKEDAKVEEAVVSAWNQLKPEQRQQLESAGS